jgi:hypothetical protein
MRMTLTVAGWIFLAAQIALFLDIMGVFKN